MTPRRDRVQRTRLHSRRIEVEGFQRSDGLWDIEGRLTDLKDHDFLHVTGVRPAGKPVHDMRLRITVDEHLRIHAAEAAMDGVPFPGVCDEIGKDYRKLVGMTVGPGFRRQVNQVLGGIQGCTHVTELLWSVATTAYQTLAQHFYSHQDAHHRKPFQIDGCHAWDARGSLVETHYPRWHRGRSSGG